MTKIEALAKHLEVKPSDLSEESSDTFSNGREEYLVLTDEEAAEIASERVRESLWSFNAEFIAAHTKNGLSQSAIEAVKEMQSKLCEDAQEIIEALIEDLEDFTKDAMRSDGRGHFISTYDGEENESGNYFIYRIN